MINWVIRILGVRAENRPAYRAILKALIVVIIFVAAFVLVQTTHAASNGKMLSFYPQGVTVYKDRGISELYVLGVDPSMRSRTWQKEDWEPAQSILATGWWEENYYVFVLWQRSDGRWGTCTFFLEPSPKADIVPVSLNWEDNLCNL